MLLDEKIVAIGRALDAASLPHAFGGANALAYYGTPRATADIDLNAFVGASRAREVLTVLSTLGVQTHDPGVIDTIARDGQVRVRWDATPVDLFFSYDPLHDSSMARRRRVDFGGDRIYVLAPEDLMVYKAIFNRAKDWSDIAEIIYAANTPLDYAYVLRWIDRICDPSDEQPHRIRRLIDSRGRDLGL